jgi:N-acetylglucosamine-6-phosphate deacetylase
VLTISSGDDTVAIEGGKIAPARGASDVTLPDGWLITPGLVDLQVNGLDDAFPLEDPSRLADLDAMLVARGVTSYLVAVISADPDQVAGLAHATQTFMQNGSNGCIGLHLEGPVLSPDHRGAHAAEFLRPGDDSAALGLLDLPGVRLVTVAPEVPGAMSYAAAAMSRRIVVAAGHSGATAEQAHDAIAAGLRLCTHLFNAMAPVHQRAPGIATAYLTDPNARVAFIADGVHLHQDIEALILAAAPDRCLLVSDAAPAGGVYADRHQGEVLAGSMKALDDGVRRLAHVHGMGLAAAARLASERPADILGESARGRLTVGARADLVIWDDQGAVAACIRGGEVVAGALPV